MLQCKCASLLKTTVTLVYVICLVLNDGLFQAEGSPQPLRAGGCTVHTGRTLHYTGGNRTDTPRRAYIVNCRPKAMVEFERQRGYDHGKAGLSGIIAGK